MSNIILFFISLLLGGYSPVVSAGDNDNKLLVFKSPTCGCCNNWISHMESNGFKVEAIDKVNMAVVKSQYGIDGPLQSCHTAVDLASGFVFEGHIPAGIVRQFLARPPVGAKGLAVPGMPAGSPGMEMGDRFDPYQVVQINEGGAPVLYMNVETQAAQYTLRTDHE